MRIVVIGGGIAGLTAAYRLHASGCEVALLEAEERPGGHVGTVREGGFTVEAGPNGFLARSNEPEPMALVRELGLEGALVQANRAARRRYIVRRGRLRPIPADPVSLVGSNAL